jgi:hypothetical protein
MTVFSRSSKEGGRQRRVQIEVVEVGVQRTGARGRTELKECGREGRLKEQFLMPAQREV